MTAKAGGVVQLVGDDVLRALEARRAANDAEVDAALEAADSDIQAARAASAELEELEASWAGQIPSLRAQLAEIRSSAGDVAVDAALAGSGAADAVRPIAERAGRVEAELETIATAVRAVRQRRIDSVRAVRKAEAAALRAKARDLRVQHVQHQRRTGEILRELEKWEGIRYVPYVGAVDGFDVRVDAAGLGRSAPTRSNQLLWAAERLESEAAAREARSAHLDAPPDGASRDEMLDWIEREHSDAQAGPAGEDADDPGHPAASNW